MSNHSNDQDPQMAKAFAELINDRLTAAPDGRVGPTGNFPRGKLTEKDEGEIGIRVAAVNQTVVIDFGKPTAWIGFPPDDARALAASLVKYADEIERTRT